MTPPIYIVDDDDGHAYLIEQNLKKSGVRNPCVRFASGNAVLEQIFSSDQASELPAFMFLDLNMPGADGREVIRQLRGQERTRCIPIAVISTAVNPHEVEDCYRLGCNVYLQKAVQYLDFVAIVQSFGAALRHIQLPHGAIVQPDKEVT